MYFFFFFVFFNLTFIKEIISLLTEMRGVPVNLSLNFKNTFIRDTTRQLLFSTLSIVLRSITSQTYV